MVAITPFEGLQDAGPRPAMRRKRQDAGARTEKTLVSGGNVAMLARDVLGHGSPVLRTPYPGRSGRAIRKTPGSGENRRAGPTVFTRGTAFAPHRTHGARQPAREQ